MNRMIDLEILREILSGVKTEHKNSLEASSIINEVWKEVLEYSEPKRKKGKWIDDGTELGCCCSECGTTLDDYFDGSLHEICLSKIPNFCPSCGSYNGGEDDGNK